MNRYVLALAILLSWPAMSLAQGYNALAPYEFNIHAGGLFPDDGDAEFLTGARFTVNRASGWGYGGNFDWVPLDDEGSDLDFDLYLYSFEVDYTFGAGTMNQLRPFVGAGAGAATIKVGDAPDEFDDTETEFLLPLAFGFKFFSRPDDPAWAFRIDLRDNIIFGENETTNNWEVSGGISFLLGRGD